ncbi:swr complex subunit [Serendipita sp. 399]|nr:swr complex subunit [Serendipita sp. 399]
MASNGASSSEGEDEDSYPFAKYTIDTPIVYSYTEEEYANFLEDFPESGWTKSETDYFFSLLKEYNGRFYIVLDRYEFPGTEEQPPVKRQIEDLKARYYGVVRKLIRARAGEDADQIKASESLILQYGFDYAGEKARREHIAALWDRAPQQIAEETLLYTELLRLSQTSTKFTAERHSLLRLLAGIESGLPDVTTRDGRLESLNQDPQIRGVKGGLWGNMIPGPTSAAPMSAAQARKKRGVGGVHAQSVDWTESPTLIALNSAGANGQRQQLPPAQQAEFDAKHHIYRAPVGSALINPKNTHTAVYARSSKFPVPKPILASHLQAYSAAVAAGGGDSDSGGGAKDGGGPETIFSKLDIHSTKLYMPTKENVEWIERVFGAATQLIEVQKQLERVEAELSRERARLGANAPPPGTILSDSPSATTGAVATGAAAAGTTMSSSSGDVTMSAANLGETSTAAGGGASVGNAAGAENKGGNDGAAGEATMDTTNDGASADAADDDDADDDYEEDDADGDADEDVKKRGGEDEDEEDDDDEDDEDGEGEVGDVNDDGDGDADGDEGEGEGEGEGEDDDDEDGEGEENEMEGVEATAAASVPAPVPTPAPAHAPATQAEKTRSGASVRTLRFLVNPHVTNNRVLLPFSEGEPCGDPARLSSAFTMTHAINLLIVDDHIYLGWYDREGIIVTSGFNVRKNLEYYLVFLFLFQRFERGDWGDSRELFCHTVSGPAASSSPFSPFSSISLWQQGLLIASAPTSNAVPPAEFQVTVDGKTFLVDTRPIHKAFAICGRGSCVLPCRRGEEKFVLKLSWPERSRETEVDILKKIYELAKDCTEIMEHVPELEASDVFDGIATDKIRHALGLATHPRHLVAMVFHRLDGILTELSDWEYWKGWWDCFTCHGLLWSLGIRHRDISIGNLMFFRDEKAKVHGVLIDFDLASTGDERTDNHQRTGTLPFMAIQLLRDPGLRGEATHHYFYDMEAFFWVAVYTTATFHKGKPVQSSPYVIWSEIHPNQLWKEKLAWAIMEFEEHTPSESHATTWKGFHRLRTILLSTITNRAPPEMDPSHRGWKEVGEKKRIESMQEAIDAGRSFEEEYNAPRVTRMNAPKYLTVPDRPKERKIVTDAVSQRTRRKRRALGGH